MIELAKKIFHVYGVLIDDSIRCVKEKIYPVRNILYIVFEALLCAFSIIIGVVLMPFFVMIGCITQLVRGDDYVYIASWDDILAQFNSSVDPIMEEFEQDEY